MLLLSNTANAACSEPNPGGNYIVTSNCLFSGTVNGVDKGGITVNEGITFTVGAGQTIVWSPGSSIIINGSLAINATGQLRQTYLWMTDQDSDGYPSSTTQIAQDVSVVRVWGRCFGCTHFLVLGHYSAPLFFASSLASSSRHRAVTATSISACRALWSSL